MIAFLEASSDWQLSESEELAVAGYPDPDLFRSWSLAALEDTHLILDEWKLLRLGAVVAIKKRSATLLPDTQCQIHWLHSPIRGPLFKGLSPYEILSDPEDAVVVSLRHEYDAWTSLQAPPSRGYLFEPLRRTAKQPKTSIDTLLANLKKL